MTLFLLFLAGVIAFAVLGVLAIARQRIRAHGPHVLAWRWLTGMPHHGDPLTDAGWGRPGTKALSQTGHVRRWWFRPREVRAAWRTGLTVAGFAAAWGLLFHRTATLLVIAVCAVAGMAFGMLWLVRWAQTVKHRRTWLKPAHLQAAPLVGLPIAASPASWLEVALDRSLVVATLPPGWNGDGPAKARLVSTLTGKLGIEAPEVRWQLAGPRPRLEIAQSAPPPRLVTLADAMPAIEAAADDEVVWGFGKKSAAVQSSLSGDSPHLGLSMGSGAGKSVTARSLLAQLLYHGAVGVILDQKEISHMWADGLPNVAVYREPAEIHAALLWLGGEVRRRNKVALAGADIEGQVHANVGSRIIVIAEELNATVDELRGYWQQIRDKKADPARPPSLTALDKVSFTGRQSRVHIVYIGQALSAKAMGGGRDSTENMGVIAFSRYKPRTWKMLASDHPMPPNDLHPGRLQVVSNRVQAAQGIKMSGAEARELALSGVVSPLPYGMPGGPRDTADTGRRDIAVHALELRKTSASASPETGPVTLRQAVEAGLLPGLNLAGARTARHRDPAFPARTGRDGLAEMYDPKALADYGRARSN